MTGKREAKREALKQRLTEAATGRMESSGLAGLRARDIAADAGCALGGLYNVYQSLDDLILHINSATLGRLNAALEQAAANTDTPRNKLVALAREYLAFAIDNRNLWQALFDHKMPEGVIVPDWHLAEHGVLFSHVAGPIASLKPDLNETELHVMARTLFAAVHGIVSISLREGFIAVPREALDEQLTEFVQTLVTGMEHSSAS
ncbi:MAG: TetR family transcriptional regulator [Hyphomicrobiales bacterium]|nr:MAG: TetR family transcriptional regulator [Hyphomicrobiales bacterium]